MTRVGLWVHSGFADSKVGTRGEHDQPCLDAPATREDGTGGPSSLDHDAVPDRRPASHASSGAACGWTGWSHAAVFLPTTIENAKITAVPND
jgi:hypothetical protein